MLYMYTEYNYMIQEYLMAVKLFNDIFHLIFLSNLKKLYIFAAKSNEYFFFTTTLISVIKF